MAARFELPELLVSPGAWGPPADAVLKQFADLPFYRDYDKSATYGRAADWTSAGEEQQQFRDLQRQKRLDRESAQAQADGKSESPQQAAGGIFGYTDDVDKEFQLVDTSSAHGGSKLKTIGSSGPAPRGRGAYTRGRGMGRAWGADSRTEGAFARKIETGGRSTGQSRYGRRFKSRWRGQKMGNLGGWGRREDERGISRPWSVEPMPEWETVHTFDIPEFSTLKGTVPSQVQDLESFGTLLCYDKNFDRATARNPKSISSAEDYFYDNVSTSSDPILKQLAASAPSDHLCVFATDSIASHLMASGRSMNSWDVIVTKKGNKVFLDKRESSEELNLLSVYENAAAPPLGPIATELHTEATFVNQQFAQNILLRNKAASSDNEEEKEDEADPTKVEKSAEPVVEHPKLQLGGETPFQPSADDLRPAAAIGYKYRRFDFNVGGNKPVSLFVRCEIEACIERSGQLLPVTVRALNESFYKPAEATDSVIDWRKKVDSQRSAVLAHELKVNANKVTKWMCESMLCDTKLIKLGYLSRKDPKNAFSHVVLATQEFQPTEFAAQIQFNAGNAWAVLQAYIEKINDISEGLFLLLREPDESAVRLMTIPNLADLEQQMNDGELDEDYDF